MSESVSIPTLPVAGAIAAKRAAVLQKAGLVDLKS